MSIFTDYRSSKSYQIHLMLNNGVYETVLQREKYQHISGSDDYPDSSGLTLILNHECKITGIQLLIIRRTHCNWWITFDWSMLNLITPNNDVNRTWCMRMGSNQLPQRISDDKSCVIKNCMYAGSSRQPWWFLHSTYCTCEFIIQQSWA